MSRKIERKPWRSHRQIIESDRTYEKSIRMAMKTNDRKSEEARARFERPVWPGLFGKEVRRYG